MPTWFIGNVLSPTETQPESHDHTFAFTKEESQNLDLTNIPIRLEHDKEMEVGHITKHWMGDDGSKWVLGRINDNGLESRFAQYAVSESSTGHRYYTGLSLQHVHTQYASGKSSKEAIEVSLCCDPRRNDCRICFVDAKPLEFETEKVTYKIRQFASKMSTEDKKVEPTPEPVAEKVEDVKSEPTPNTTEMMEVIVRQQQDLEKLQKESEELAKLRSEIKEAEEKALEADRAKNEALAKSLVETWASTLDKADLTEDSQKQIMAMAKEFPRESAALLRVAHHASKKYAEKKEEFEQALSNKEQTVLEKQFNEVMTKQKTVHAASAKAAPVPEKTKKQHFMDALTQYRVSGGSAREKMEQVLEAQKPKRRRMF